MGPTTIINTEGGAIKREIENKELSDNQVDDNYIINSFENIGGMK